MKIKLSSHFHPLLQDRHRYLVLCGGRGSGKSEFAARKLFYRCLTEGSHRFLVLRKVRASCKDSVIRVLQTVLAENGIGYEWNKTDRVIAFTPPLCSPSEILFNGMDDPEKIKSIKGITGVWIEEATEFTLQDFIAIDLILREAGPEYLQIIMSFNPDEAQAPWLKERFFNLDVPPYTNDPDSLVDVSTVEHNPIKHIREEYLKRLDLIGDETLKQIYRFGIWAVAKGRIYSWDVRPIPEDIVFDEVWYGGDFGFSVDPAAVVRIHRKANEYWLQEVLYQTGMTNSDIASAMKSMMPNDHFLTVWDSAETKSIEELRRLGLYVVGADKGPDSVKAGIDFLKSQIIHITPDSPHLIKESSTYKWREDGRGNPLPIPVKFDDHALDAARYGIVYNANIKRNCGFEAHS